MIIILLALAILSLHLKPSYHSRRKLQRIKEKNMKVKRKIVLIVTLKPLKHFLQEGIPKAKKNTKVKFF